MPAELLEVEDLTIRFQLGGPAVVDGLSISLKQGETLSLVGESGCGKSLTALAIMGLLPPGARTTGRVRLEGEDLFAAGERRLADLRGNRLAMIFQEPMASLNPAFRIGEQIAESVVRHRGLKHSEARERALHMLRAVRIPTPEKRLDAYPHQLSGGMRQRVMIAMALVNAPQIRIADEPTTALDVTIQAQLLALVRELQREVGMAMILVTHDLGVVAETADRVAVMYAGRIVETAAASDLFADPQHPYTLGLIGSLPSLGRRQGRLATIPGSVPPPDRFPPGCRFATVRSPAGAAMPRCRRCAPSVPKAIRSPASRPRSTNSAWSRRHELFRRR